MVLESGSRRAGIATLWQRPRKLIKHGLKQFPGPMLVGIGQGGALGGIGQSQMPQLALAGRQPSTDFAQGVRLPQVTKQHGDELPPTTKAPRVALGPVFGDRRLEFQARKTTGTFGRICCILVSRRSVPP